MKANSDESPGRSGGTIQSLEAPGKRPGTYGLLMRSARPGRLRVGSAGQLALKPGLYLYLGSAFGPGGLGARLGRHTTRSKSKHWHIDYLRPRTSLICAFFSTSSERLEHLWASRILALPEAEIPLTRFGASDCRCPSHLFFFPACDSRKREIGLALEASGGGHVGVLEANSLRGLARRGSRRRHPI